MSPENRMDKRDQMMEPAVIGTGFDEHTHQQHHHSSSPTFSEALYDAQRHADGFQSGPPSQQVAFAHCGMQSWNPYLASMSASNDNTPTEYGLPYTVNPGSLELTNEGIHPALSQEHTSRQAVWPVNIGCCPDAAGQYLVYAAASGPGFDQQQPDHSYTMHCRQHPKQQFYPFQAATEAALLSSQAWSNQNIQTETEFRQQDPTHNVDPYQQHPPSTETTTHTPSTAGIKRDKAADNKDDDVTPTRATKKRGRKPKASRPDLAPLTTWPTTATDQLQQSQSSTSLHSYASASSSALYDPNSMSSATGSSVSFSSDVVSHEASDNGKHSSNNSNNNDEYQVSPHSAMTTSFGNISSSPIPTMTTTITTTSFSTPQSYRHQPPPHHRASFSSSITPRNLRLRQTRSSIDLGSLPGPLPKDQKARNRQAATKCRLKTKAAITRLEEEEQAASERHAALADLAAGLKDEVYMLRNQLLLHTNCQCTLIRQYLENTAKALASGINRPIPVELSRRMEDVGSEDQEEDDDEKSDKEESEDEDEDAEGSA